MFMVEALKLPDSSAESEDRTQEIKQVPGAIRVAEPWLDIFSNYCSF